MTKSDLGRPGPLARPLLSLFTLLALALLIGLGVWQVQRLQWKTQLLADVARARSAPAQPLSAALEDARAGRDVAFRRVTLECEDRVAPEPPLALYDLFEGRIAWRALTACSAGERILVDRGIVEAALGSVARPDLAALPAPRDAVGVLRKADNRRVYSRSEGVASLQDRSLSPLGYYVAVEQESPGLPGLRPTPLPTEVSNRHLGYAITWFGLAAALAGVYLAMMFKRPASTRE